VNRDTPRDHLLDPPTGPVDVVIDTDATNEVDDQFAIVWALLRPDRLRVRALHACPYALGPHVLTEPAIMNDVDRARLAARGVTPDVVPVVSAQEGMERAEAECRRLVDLVGVDVPVRAGAARLLPDERTPVRSDAVDDLIALAHEDREGPLYVLGIGAATNLASAVLVEPGIRDRVVVVWTSAHPSFWPYPNTSFNLAQDLPATRALLDSGVPLVYLPGYYVGEHLRISRPELDAHVRGTGPVGDDLHRLLAGSHWLPDRPGASKVIWDLVNVAWVLDPDWVRTVLTSTPRLADDLTWQREAGRPLMREGVAVDRDAVWGDLFRVLRGR
jgi:purine nucleosidase